MPKPKLKTSESSNARDNYGYTDTVYSISSSNASNPSLSSSSNGNYSTANALKIDYDDTGEATVDDIPDIQSTEAEVAGYRLLPVASKDVILHDSGSYVENRSTEEEKSSASTAQLEPAKKGGDLKFSSGTNAIVNAYKERDWNKEFQSIMAESQFLFSDAGDISAVDDWDKYGALSHLARDFIYASKLYAKVIISELCVPNEHKTIKPVKIGGIAGGDKYICGGILFKFALDTRGLYGGDEYAMKAASHELKGLQCLYQAGIALGLNFPLMSVIDYRGYRVVALSLLPISKETIIYGSSDAGQTVHASDAGFNQRMAQAAHVLNLKGHKAGPTQTMVFGPADIEGHKSKADGKYYIVDFARLMPPQVRLERDKASGRQTHLFQLLRPELVQSHNCSLSSDALTGLGKSDPDRRVHNEEVIGASKRLFEIIIPSFVQMLERERALDLRASKQLCDQIHSAGINIRHLGLLFSAVKPRYPIIRKALLTEMAARILKDDIKAKLRVTMQRVRVPSEEPYRLTLLQYLNSIFVTSSADYWEGEFPARLRDKFVVPATDSLFSTSRSQMVLDLLDKADLISRFQQLSGVKLTKGAVDLLQLGTSELTARDVALRVVVKNMNIVEHSAGCSLAAQALRRDGAEAQRLFAQAVESFASAMSTSPLSSSTLYQWGSALHRLSRKIDHMNSGRDSVLVLREAVSKLEKSTQINKIFHPARVEAVNAIIDLIVHVGRFMIPEQQRKQDTDALYEAAAVHFAAAVKLEQLSEDNTSIDQSVNRLKQMINQLDAFRLLVLIHILYRSSEVKAPHATMHRRLSSMTASGQAVTPLNLAPALGKSSSSLKGQKRDFSQVLQSYFQLVATKVNSFTEVEIPDGGVFDQQSLQFFVENLSPKRIRSVTLNRCLDLDLSLLELPSASSAGASGSNSSRSESGLSRSSSLNEKTAQIVSSNSSNNLSTSGSSTTGSSSGRAALERTRAPSRPQSIQIALPQSSSGAPNGSGTSSSPPVAVKERRDSDQLAPSSSVTALISPRSQLGDLASSGRARSSIQFGSLGKAKDKEILREALSTSGEKIPAPAPPPALAKLRYLNVARCSRLNAIPGQLMKLKTLNLASTDFDDEGVRALVVALPQITSLDLSGCSRLTPRVFEYLAAARLPRLRTLIIGREISTKISSSTNAIQIEDPMISIASLHTLDLSGVQSLGRLPLQKIADFCTSLTHLDCHNVKNINDVGMLPVLRKCRDLVYLDLSSTQIGNATVKAIGQNLTGLTKLKLGQNGGLQDDVGLEGVLRANPDLEEVDLSSCFKITDASFAFLGVDGTPSFPAMKRLSLYLDSLITDQSINFIVKQFPSLAYFDLTSLNKISNLSLIAISKHAIALKKLSVGYCLLVSDDGLIPLARKCTSLTSLSLAQCRQITDKAILEVAKNVTSLKTLDISKSELISSMAVQQLLQRNRGMEALVAIECKELSGDFLFQKCRHSCPKLDILVERTKKVTPCLWDLPHEVSFEGSSKT